MTRPFGRGPSPRADVVGIGAAALVLGLPLLSGAVLAGHDMRTYLMYAPQIVANLRDGIVLPAWAPDLNGGYGGPGLLFYPPLVHVLHALGCLLGLPAVLSIGLLTILGSCVSGVALRAWLGAEGWDGTLAAPIVYMAAPYRVIDVYERTALSEHWAFVFPPLILWALASGRLSRGRRVAAVAAGVAALVLTNLPLAALFAPVLAAYALPAGGDAGRRWDAALGAALGVGVALFALVPAALSGRFMATELFYGGSAGDFTPSLNTLFGTPPNNPGFHQRVSVAALVTFLLVAVAFASSSPGGRKVFFVAVGTLSFAFMLKPFGPVWDLLPVLSKLQFPWRLSGVTTFAVAALVAGARPRARTAIASLAVLASLGFCPGRQTAPLADLPLAAPEPAPPGTAFPDPAAVVESAALASHPGLSNPKLTDLWYLPRTLGEPLAREIYLDGPPALPGLERAAAAALGGQPLRFRVAEWRRLRRSVSVSVERPTTVVLHSLYFPGMGIEIDGQRARAAVERRTGLLAAVVPAGDHVVTWTWRPFPPLGTARIASLVCLLAVLSAAVFPWSARRPAAAPRS
ncbi:MAG TPA: hypothetical protein VLH41_09545 [Thermoanaerobaculia bacterium]|nr:hypothetical protein [Thermoanaerobaculia bacterium]